MWTFENLSNLLQTHKNNALPSSKAHTIIYIHIFKLMQLTVEY